MTHKTLAFLQAHFIFFQRSIQPLKKIKKACKPTHGTVQDDSKLDRTLQRPKISTSDNSGFKKLAVQCLIEHLYFVSTAMLADSFVLRNRQLLKPPNVTGKF